ncbi:MAG: T9SS type A sorting domain-containing protein [Marinoscillum sp.]|uniref:T9SS type A sorting domain-containing protein n=3 Tax=Marinoscillum sp. TaxID=2024838 RepID=UPI0032FEE499
MIVSSTAFGQFYWVGDGGNWSDYSAHWATTSGGSTFHPNVPGAGDDVFFDANSFTIGGQIVTLDQVGSVNNISFSGVTNSPTFTGSNDMTIAGDLTLDDDLTFTVTGDMTFSSSGNITIELGSIARSLPDFYFPNTSGTIQINTGSSANTTDRVVFGAVTVSTAGVTFTVEGNNVNSNAKTFGEISLPANCTYNIRGPNGSGFGAGDGNVFSGDFIVGANGDGNFRGDYTVFQGNVDLGANGEVRWQDQVEFDSHLTIEGSSGSDILFSQNMELDGDLNLTGSTTVVFDRTATIGGDIVVTTGTVSSIRIDRATTVAGNLTVGTDAILSFTNTSDNSPSLNISGTVDLSDNVVLTLGDGVDAPYTMGNITCGSSVDLTFDNGAESVSLASLTMGDFNIVKFNSAGSGTSFSGNLISNGDCSSWRTIKSNTPGVQANLSFSGVQTVDANVIQDIAVSGASFTDNSGIDKGNNSGITFSGSHSPASLYWIGGNSGNWSDEGNWSTTSGGSSGICIPSGADNVYFDANSFSGVDPSVTLDLALAEVQDMDWSGVNTAVRWEGLATNSLYLYGDLILDADVTSNYLGTIVFTMSSATTNYLTSNGVSLMGTVEFDFSGGTWTLVDDLDINGDDANLTITNGTLSAGSNTISLQNNWTVSAGGAFTAGTGTVLFDGQNSSGDQEVDAGSSSFYNLTIDRQSSGGSSAIALLSDITINNDLTIQRGRLEDDGFQITGSAGGTLTIQNGEWLRLGSNTVATLFPIGFGSLSLSNQSIVEYRSRVDQDVEGGITYGRIFMAGGGNASRSKVLQGPITVNGELRIDDYNDFFDNGYQITGASGQTFRMDANSSFTIGTSSTTTQFPTGHDSFNIDANSEIIYASGQDDAQVIKALNGGGNSSYANLTLTNASGVQRIKALGGDLDIRGDLNIGDANTMDLTASNYTFDLEGDLLITGSGMIDFRNGSLILDGSAQQVLDFGGSTPLIYDLIVNNASGVILADNLTIENSVDLQNGIVTQQGAEIITMNAGSYIVSVSDASFIDGEIEKIGGTAFTFPVGDGGSYRPISISASGTATDGFQARYFGSSPHPSYPINSREPGLERVSALEYWTLNVTNGSPTVDVTLSWDAQSEVEKLDDLRVAHWNGSSWDNYGNNGTTGNETDGTIVASGVSSFSPITHGSSSLDNSLPVTWLYFIAKRNQSEVVVKWGTASELSNSHFIIERSQNGENWKELGKVIGQGNSKEKVHYTFSDQQPLSVNAYYRIKQVDFDGKYEYSEIKMVDVLSIGDQLRIYPNPAQNVLTVQSDDYVLRLEIFDLAGVSVMQLPEGFLSREIDVSELDGGLYIIHVKYQEGYATHKLIISK